MNTPATSFISFLIISTFFLGCTNDQASDKTAEQSETKPSPKRNDSDIFSVSILVPQGSGLAFNLYKTYTIVNDSFFVMDPHTLIDTLHKDTILEKYPVDSIKMNNLKQIISGIDSIGFNSISCIDIVFGRTRFYLSFNDHGRKRSGLIANIYIEKLFKIVDLFNTLARKEVVGYDKEELLQDQKDCEKKWKHK